MQGFPTKEFCTVFCNSLHISSHPAVDYERKRQVEKGALLYILEVEELEEKNVENEKRIEALKAYETSLEGNGSILEGLVDNPYLEGRERGNIHSVSGNGQTGGNGGSGTEDTIR